jgi:DNA/RNA endonuclease YhcR with UshA esterase domain
LFVLFAFAPAWAAESTNSPALLKIGAAAATNYYDQTVVVTGRVAQVTIRPTVTFLNLDKPHPDSPFTVVIFHGHSEFFGDANALKRKDIEIRGKVKNYKDKPEIILDTMDQLTVLGATNAPATVPAVPAPKARPAASETNLPDIM